VTDGLQAAGWILVLGVGIAGCVQLRRWGVPRTYIRDLLHIGAGIWVLGWPFWNQWLVPISIAACAALLVASAPHLAQRLSVAASFQDSVSDQDERWAGLVWYTVAFALLTAAGMRHQPFSAAAALWALCLGDGIGGAIGRRFGRRYFRIAGGKRKSLEGSAAVWVGSAAAAVLASAYFAEPLRIGRVLLLGLVAALAEALSPKAMDNILVPLTVWLAAVATAV